MDKQKTLHATCVTIGDAGILLIGPSGSGKSDLALRLLDQPGRGTGSELLECKLVSDDQTLVWREGHQLLATAPDVLRGHLEVRGLGIVSFFPLAQTQIHLALQLCEEAEIERMPDLRDQTVEILGISIPKLMFHPFSPSAPAKLRAAVQNLDSLFSR